MKNLLTNTARQLLDYLKGDLQEDKRQETERLLNENPSLARVADEFRDSRNISKALTDMKRFDTEAALQQIRLQTGQKAREQRLWPWRVAAAVIVCLAVGGTYWYWQYTRVVPPTLPQPILLAMEQSIETGRQSAEIEREETVPFQSAQRVTHRSDAATQESSCLTTRSDKEFWLRLTDGTMVHLNYNTRLIYPEQFVGDTREVTLEGEAYFMVARDRRHPFIVHTPQGDIKEYGTEFNVRTRHNTTEVVLIEGSISVTPTNGQERMMKPGEKLTIEESHLTLTNADTEAYRAWNEGVFLFRDTRLEDLMEVVGRWYGFDDVQYTDPALRDIRFTGTIDRYGSADAIIRSISKVTGRRIVVKGSHIDIE